MNYRAVVGEHVFNLEFDARTVKIDGQVVEVSFAPSGPLGYTLIVDRRSANAVIEPADDHNAFRVSIDGQAYDVRIQDERDLLLERFGINDAAGIAAQRVHAPMPGLVRRILVEEGERVEPGQGLLVLEAMKMENELRAEIGGLVHAVAVNVGAAVGKNDLLVEIVGGE